MCLWWYYIWSMVVVLLVCDGHVGVLVHIIWCFLFLFLFVVSCFFSFLFLFLSLSFSFSFLYLFLLSEKTASVATWPCCPGGSGSWIADNGKGTIYTRVQVWNYLCKGRTNNRCWILWKWYKYLIFIFCFCLLCY